MVGKPVGEVWRCWPIQLGWPPETQVHEGQEL